MPCYRPLALVDTGSVNPDTGKHVMSFVGRMKEILPLDDPLRDSLYMVPCNRCIGCRLDYAREWSNRMLCELADNPDALFLTLTYDNDHVPKSDLGYMSTSVRDCQLFFKRLRRHFKDKKIRYFLGAEYGPKFNRPHYHCILFGLSFSDFPDLVLRKKNRLLQPLFSSEILQKIWGNGFCIIGSASKDSCSYVARYMLKKYKGFDRLNYDAKHIELEFSLCSRRPGIGLGYFDKHSHKSNVISVFDGEKVNSFPVPKKLFDKLATIDSDSYEVLKAIRRETASARSYLEYLNSDLEFLDYLKLSESDMYRKIKGVSDQLRLEI